MGWILAAINTPAKVCDAARGLVHQAPSSLFQVEDQQFYIAAGGISASCIFHLHKKVNSGWIVSGSGITRQGSGCKMLMPDDWQNALGPDSVALPVNGHYAILRWRDGVLEAFTDSLGVRTLYYVVIGKGLIVTTRLDWAAQLSGRREIDFTVFGSHWLSFNQLSFDAPINGVQRLGPNGRLEFTEGRLSADHSLWRPQRGNHRPADFADTLEVFANPDLPPPLKLSLGLSGGLDSRVLLALLDRKKDPQLHTFGPAERVDVQVATDIARITSFPHRVLHEPVSDADACIALLRDYVAKTQALTSASAIMGLRYFHTLHEDNLVVIDGAFGEAARRQFLNRLLRRGAGILRSENFESIVPMLSVSRAGIFTSEVRSIMERGVIEQFHRMWEQLPPVEEFGLENALDLFSTWTRLPNFFGYEQNRLDSTVLCYMPFAQPEVLNTIFSIPARHRKEGRLFKEIIRSRHPALARFPLVKGSIRYPFLLSSTGAFVWTKIKSTIGRPEAPVLQHAFLHAMREYALDTVSSQKVKGYAAYDYKKILERVEAYYKGQENLSLFVDWWLSFEVWRQEINKTSF